MKQLDKRTKNTYLVITLLLASALAATAFWYDDYSAEIPNCSYLNPFLIDILAFIIGILLVIDALYHAANPKTRAQWGFILMRFAIGVAIITVHVYQVIRK